MLGEHKISTVVVSSNPLSREGLKAMLRATRYDVVEEAAELQAATQHLPEGTERGLILVAFGGREGEISSVDLRRAGGETKLVLLINRDDCAAIPGNLCEAASAIVDQNVSVETLSQILELIFSGLTVQMPGISARWTPRAQATPGHSDGHTEASAGWNSNVSSNEQIISVHKLSPRELDVLKHLAGGASNKIIARACDLAEATVKIHVKNVLRKLKTQNRTQAALWAIEHGIRAQSL
ncbi:LuxR C-terminal-related transcriptional regulator [Methylobacterium planeticum]|uniref:Response regulator transcription factor n=1 Tax=Methylobacterium planeticum TaxID=2615211 RepID=A0A6N6MMV3_9HYPH|nr:response regulator transcription factor [Methylobacterium planeticum]KAB1072592.1 response regulator transcription factor [Methylobacterium planeticum]